MIVFRTEQKSNASGATRITATVYHNGKRRQATVPYEHKDSVDTNHYRAAGVLANKVLSAEQQAKVWHPSGRQRVTSTRDGARSVINIDV